MKYKDWLKQQQQPTPVDTLRGSPIHCPDCGKLIGYDKDFMYMLISHPIVCPNCDEIVIFPSVMYTYTYTYTPFHTSTATTKTSTQEKSK